jgi:glycine betaine/proline transport system permease protein
MASLSDLFTLPLADWINVLVREWLVPNFRPAFRAMQWPITQVLSGFEAILQATPFLCWRSPCSPPGGSPAAGWRSSPRLR